MYFQNQFYENYTQVQTVSKSCMLENKSYIF